jgi:predicted ATPase with chaperone activity
MSQQTMTDAPGLMDRLLGHSTFEPDEPRTLEQAGLNEALVDAFICKQVKVLGSACGRALAEHLCLPFGILEERFQRLRSRQILTHKGSAPLNDYIYTLTEEGREHAQRLHAASAYVGPAPVPLADYINAVEAQTITAESPQKEQLEAAFQDISINTEMFNRLGPAINSGAGLFLYGPPGNGKTTLAERITLCFGQEIWLPRVLIVDDEIIKLYDPAYHKEVPVSQNMIFRQQSHDQRWTKIRRPTVIVGGELTMDCLEIRHDPRSNISEAPLQMKSNNGSLLIDDFGRQRLDPVELLNRWIVPLERRFDFLTLASGKKIQVPFDQLILFSTNLEPTDLADEAFLRRIPYKINVPDPDEEEFHRLFEIYAPTIGCDYNREAVDHLLDQHYRPTGRPLRRCHPRDLLLQTRNYCRYVGCEVEMKAEYFDLVVENYFTVVGNQCKTSSRQT